MKRLVNGTLVSVDAVPPLPSSVDGVFETVLLRDRQPVFWEAHWQRFLAGCRHFALELPFTEDALNESAAQLIEANQVRHGVLRYGTWRDEAPQWSIDVTPPRPHMAKPVFTVAPGPALPELGGEHRFKHLRREFWLDALHAAREHGHDEVLLADHAGNIVEGAVSNVFLVRGDELCTPALTHRPLPGVMRAEILSFARQLGWAVTECAIRASDLRAANEVWLSNSLIGLRPVGRFADTTFGPTPRLEALRAAWRSRFGWDSVVVL
jgi:branched-subunit amino acid aminotransferase/4-amino-4-deoxychorismate lyase